MSKKSKKRRATTRSRRQRSSPDRAGNSPAVESTELQYIHEPLPEQEKFFRILELLPGRCGSVIQCRLRIHSIHFHPNYDAISYVWGAPEGKVDILCHRKRLRVPRNLRDVLERLRDERTPRILWADSVCINQEDPTEKGHQVQLMCNIFRNASCVYAWLGRGDDFDAETACRTLRALRDAWVSGGSRNLDLEANRCSEYEWDQIEAFVTNDWFSRMWILQEVGLASYAIIMCGPNRIPWEVLQELGDIYNRSLYYFSRNGLVGSIGIMDLDFQGQQEQDVRLILQLARKFHCSDLRDKVYALLGHDSFHKLQGKAKGEPFLTADYSLSIADVYFNTTVKQMALPEPLNILSMVQHCEKTFEDPNFELPSWVPRFDIEDKTWILQFPEEAAYCAGTGSLPQFNIHNKMIEVSGAYLDSILWTSNTMVVKGRSWDDVGPTIQSIWEKIEAENGYHDGSSEDIMRRFCPTLSARNRAEEAELFSSWCNEKVEKIMSNALSYFRECKIGLATVDALSLDFSEGDLETFFRLLHTFSDGRRFFISRKGFYGLAPRVSRPGDKVCVLYGARVPFILRPKSERGEYLLCGECYFEDWMYGKAMHMFGPDDAETFTLA